MANALGKTPKTAKVYTKDETDAELARTLSKAENQTRLENSGREVFLPLRFFPITYTYNGTNYTISADDGNSGIRLDDGLTEPYTLSDIANSDALVLCEFGFIDQPDQNLFLGPSEGITNLKFHGAAPVPGVSPRLEPGVEVIVRGQGVARSDAIRHEFAKLVPEWSPNTQYYRYNFVRYGEKMYYYNAVMSSASGTVPPGSPGSNVWQLFATLSDLSQLFLENKLNSTVIAPDYDPAETYEIGDPVTYQGDVYTANQAITVPETWNPAHWTKATMAEMIDMLTVIDDQLVPLDGPGSSTVSAFGNAYLPGHFSDWLSVGAGNMAYTARNATTQDWAYPTELFTDRFVFAVKAPLTGGYGAFRRSLSFPFSGVYRVSIEYTPIKQGATPLQLPVVIGLSCNGGETVWNNVGQREYGRLHSAYALVSAKAGTGFIDVMAKESGDRNGFGFSRLKVELVDKAGVEVAEVDDELSPTSENPVQNKVIANKLDNLLEDISMPENPSQNQMAATLTAILNKLGGTVTPAS